MAISEIHASGGAKGMKINSIVEDGASDPKTYNEKSFEAGDPGSVPTGVSALIPRKPQGRSPCIRERTSVFLPTY